MRRAISSHWTRRGESLRRDAFSRVQTPCPSFKTLKMLSAELRPFVRSMLSLFISASVFATAAVAQPPTIFLVRHAERAAISGRVPSDTGLSPAGQDRAQHLAEALKDAKITAIYTSEFKRTQETAAPLAQSLGIRAEVIPGDDLRRLVAKLKASQGNVLVIGHSNTLPQIINALGVSSRVTVAESDYDNLFLVVRAPDPQLIRLHYR
jgi:phosphohistidine phosphatase SixA